ncbi:hypothetical protein ACJJID_00130 (plasmid) [Microbulbifer sp. CnH-101-G]|uniref:hypothetical protein n=1 Tax=Microbulbifer sp. CnH-101-G TaxID=3243393 RepID=UPI004039B447
MRTIEFTLPEKTILLNEWQRLHWRKRKAHAERLALLVVSTLQVQKIRRPSEPFRHCQIDIVRGSSSLPDWDGLYGGLKPLLDTFVVRTMRNPHGLGLIDDDNPRCVVSLNARPEKARPGLGFTEVSITEVLEDSPEFSNRFGGAR